MSEALDQNAPDPTAAEAASALTAVTRSVAAFIASKPWKKSLTLQGAMVTAAIPGALSVGPVLLSACGVSPADAHQAVQAVAEIMGGVAALMTTVGRLRLGGLH